MNVVLFQIKSLEKELEEHQAYKPKAQKAKHGQLQVCANTTTSMLYEQQKRLWQLFMYHRHFSQWVNTLLLLQFSLVYHSMVGIFQNNMEKASFFTTQNY